MSVLVVLGGFRRAPKVRGFPMEPYGTAAEVRYRLPVVTLAIIAVNVVIYLATSYRNGFISIDEGWLYGGGFIPALFIHNPVNAYRIATSMFLHADILHIFFNMYFLYIFGKGVENTIGHLRFLALYLVSGFFATIFHTAFSMLQGVEALAIPAIGASGAISGVLGAYLMLYPGTSLTACWFFLYFPFCFTMRAAYYLLFWFATQVIYGYARLGASIAFFAHAGGFVAGIAVLPVVASRARIYVLKMRSAAGRVFDFITFGYREPREGLPGAAKAILTLLIAALLVGAAYSVAQAALARHTGMYVASVTLSRGVEEVTDNVVLKVVDNSIKPATVVNPDTRVLFNRLWYAGLLLSRDYAGREVEVSGEVVSAEICGVKVPVYIERFKGVYDSKGLLVRGSGSIASRVVQVTYVRGVCIGRVGEEVSYTFNLNRSEEIRPAEGVALTALVSLAAALTALYSVTKKDRELVIVS